MPSEPTIHETGVDLTIVGDEELFHGESQKSMETHLDE